MNLEPECIGCLFNQVINAYRLLEEKVSREHLLTLQKEVMKNLLECDVNSTSAPKMGEFLYNLIASSLGKEDPYKELKNEYNELALSFYEEVKRLINKSKDPLFTAVVASALGNTIDFASQHKIDLISDIRNFSPENLVINDFPSFKQALSNFNQILIIGDNAGEIVFDKILIETLMDLYKDLEVIYVVRAAPIINDVTMNDAIKVGLTEIVKVIESSTLPGIDMDFGTPEFLKYLHSKNNFILTKGQGNFESLHGVPLKDKEVFYLLKAKCSLMERIFKVKIGGLIFKRKTSEFEN